MGYQSTNNPLNTLFQLKYLGIICLLLIRCSDVNNRKTIENISNESQLSYDSQDNSLFNNKFLQDSLDKYISLYGQNKREDRFPQIFCIYVYTDRNNDTIVDLSHSVAFRTDLKELFGIYTKGETSIRNNRIIVRYRGISSFPEINESILKESDADSINCFTEYPELLDPAYIPSRVKSDSRLYKLITKLV